MKGICFTEPLFHKVVKGEKTQTRRVATHQHFSYSELSNVKQGVYIHPAIPKYKVGEKVYLKEPYAETCDEYGSPLIAYRFDNAAFYLIRKDENGDYYQLNTIKKPVSTNWTLDNFPACGEWKNKLFMPQWAARYFIEITEIRAERLQDITEEDCIKEGIESFTKDNQLYKFGLDGWDWSKMPRTPREAYAALINKISGKGTWESNPFVWVYDFKLVK